MNKGFYEFSRGRQETTSSVFPYTGSAIITGSLTVTGSVRVSQGITGSLFGTSSFAVSASWAPTSATSSYALQALSASFATNSNTSISSSFATSASFIINALTASYVNPLNQTVIITGSLSNGYQVYGLGEYSHAEGQGTIASSPYSHAEGQSTVASGYASHAEGINTITGYRTQNLIDNSLTSSIVPGASSEVTFTFEGDYTSFYPASLFATVIYDDFTFSFQDTIFSSSYNGTYTTVFFTNQPPDSYVGWIISSNYGDYSHAEGQSTVASGIGSHAEGATTQAIGNGSHAEGNGTIALGNYQHVQGLYNITSSTQGAFIVGNGTDNNNRSNLVFAAGNTLQVTGSVRVSQGITGSLFGTSSYATTASYAQTTVNALNSLTASYVENAQTASYVLQAVSSSFATTASFALNAGGGGASFPYTGSAQITGSLGITGSLTSTSTTLLNTVSGNTAVGLPSDTSTARLQVRGTGATSATNTLLLQNSSLTNLLTVKDSGQIQLGNYTTTTSFPGTATAALSVDSSGNVITTAVGGGGGTDLGLVQAMTVGLQNIF